MSTIIKINKPFYIVAVIFYIIFCICTLYRHHHHQSNVLMHRCSSISSSIRPALFYCLLQTSINYRLIDNYGSICSIIN